MFPVKILVILPCNKFAKEGNYFKGRYWKDADKIRKKLNLNVSFAAIDCIPVFKKGENDAIVLETEMHRVVGEDVYPEYDETKIPKLADAIKNGLLRVSKSFDKIIILLNVKFYIEATKKALETIPEGIRNKITFHSIYGFPGKFRKLIITELKKLKSPDDFSRAP